MVSSLPRRRLVGLPVLFFFHPSFRDAVCSHPLVHPRAGWSHSLGSQSKEPIGRQMKSCFRITLNYSGVLTFLTASRSYPTSIRQGHGEAGYFRILRNTTPA